MSMTTPTASPFATIDSMIVDGRLRYDAEHDWIDGPFPRYRRRRPSMLRAPGYAALRERALHAANAREGR